MNYNNNNKEQASRKIRGTIKTLVADLMQLAPHPDRLDHKGAVFLKNDSNLSPHTEADSLGGSLMMEQMLGVAFASAANDIGESTQTGIIGAAQTLNWNDIMEIAGEWNEDRAEPNNPRGKGTHGVMGSHNTTCNIFNEAGADTKTAMHAYFNDLPERQVIESHLAELLNALYALPKNDNQEPTQEMMLNAA